MKRKANLFQQIMDESICMPGFPQVIVTRGFCYQWLSDCGWSQSERGYGSLDYQVFASPVVDAPLYEPADRDYWLNKVRADYIREA